MPTTVLNLTDLDNLIHRFETKYKVSSVEMLRDPSVRAKIAEDVLLRWEGYVCNRIALREIDEETRRHYLSNLGPESDKSHAPSDILALAA